MFNSFENLETSHVSLICLAKLGDLCQLKGNWK